MGVLRLLWPPLPPLPGGPVVLQVEPRLWPEAAEAVVLAPAAGAMLIVMAAVAGSGRHVGVEWGEEGPRQHKDLPKKKLC